MATVLLGVAGGIVGGAFGGPLGATIGRALGALAGSYLDNTLINALTPPTQGPRLTTTDIQTSTEGAVIGRQYGRARVPGQMIWATRFLETSETTGGKGGGLSQPATNYSYFANFAVGLGEGPIACIGRIWADGSEIDQSLYTFRTYLGTEDQLADPLIEAKETNSPAYRGLAYVVFELLPIATWGNRIPQLSFEVFRPVGALEDELRGVALIAGNEFGLDPELVTQSAGTVENRHTLVAATDFLASIEALQRLMPNITSVLLVVTWFGDDLRAGSCTVRPKVDAAGKLTTPLSWTVSSLTRSTALVVSQYQGTASSGGSPNDASLIRAIQELNARGLEVMLAPFMQMDIAQGNTLPNPYSAGAATIGQPAYPWRGRITCSPAPGETGTVDKTATAGDQVAAFVGTAAAGDFAAAGTTVSYAGPDEWSYRRFVLHYAHLAALAGGVESFLVGTEMVGLTQVRSDASTYPFVAALQTLAADVSGVLGAGVKVGYAADWSEYNCHRPADASGDVLFNLDPLWADANIDFVGIDNYLPLADWREGTEHLDFNAAGPTTIYDADYLKANCAAGENYDWYYADQAARDAQARTAIADTDPAAEHWIFRQKDILGWWQSPHHDRPAGVRSAAVTAWTPEAKPVRFVEMGCPAVDKGANEPNVFPDPKSSESGLPHYSTGARDDAMQRAFYRAIFDFYGDVANNPVSGIYGAAMLDLARSHGWAWDARPWPSFPLDTDWGDFACWETGHWLSGRLGAAPARETIEAILDAAGFAAYAVEPIAGVVDGVTLGSIISTRSILESVQPAYQFDAVESDGVIKFIARLGRQPVATLEIADLVVGDGGPRAFNQTRTEESALPAAVKISYGDPARDDQPAGVEARRSTGGGRETLSYSLPVTAGESIARGIAETELHAAWVGRESAAFGLPPSRMALDPGDIVDFAPTQQTLRLASLSDGDGRAATGIAVDTLAYGPVLLPRSAGRAVVQQTIIAATPVFVDGAMLDDGDSEYAGYLGAMMSPWRSGVAAWRSPTNSGYVLDGLLPAAATIGVTTADFYAGPTDRWDRVNALYLDVLRGTLSSVDELLVLNGANVLMLENQNGEWEYLQFATATPNGGHSYILQNLIRGVRGTEHAMRSPVPAGARIMLASAAVLQPAITPAMVGLELNWKLGPADRDIGDAAFVNQTVTLTGKGRRPLSPARLWGLRNAADGDWTISWFRRTRLGGDSWDVAEVPLGEASENYLLEILSGPSGAVLRSFSATSPSQLYTSAQQIADFGANQLSFYARVAQLSDTFGAGIPLTEQIWVR